MFRHASWMDKVCHHHPERPTWEVSVNEEVPQSVNCLLPAQCQTGKNPLGWVNRKLFAFLRMFSGASLLDLGWKVRCRGNGMCGHQCQNSGGRGTDHTDDVWKIQLTMISSIPSHFGLGITSLKHGWCEMGTLTCALIFWVVIWSWTLMLRKLLAFPILGTPTIVSLPQGE